MSNYRKVTKEEIIIEVWKLIKLDFMGMFSHNGFSAKMIANALSTSEYQSRKYLKELIKDGFCTITKVPTYYEEYWNGLYTHHEPILFCRTYVFVFDKLESNVIEKYPKLYDEVQRQHDKEIEKFNYAFEKDY